jgi:hypothetical protein
MTAFPSPLRESAGWVSQIQPIFDYHHHDSRRNGVLSMNL